MDDDLATSTRAPDIRLGELDAVPVPVAIHRPGGALLHVNPAFARLVGAPDPGALVGRHLTELVHPDDLLESLALVAGPVAGGNRWSSLRLDGGGTRHVEVHQVPVVVDGDPALLALVAEVTDRVEDIAALRASEVRFRTLVQDSHDMVAVHLDGRFTFVSPAVTRVLGWEEGELLGRPITSITHPEDVPALLERMAERQDGVTGTTTGTYRLRTKDGGWRTVETTSAPSPDPAVEGVIVNARDVTATAEAREALRRSEARHRALVEHLSDVIVVADATGRITYVSPGIDGVVGHPVDDVVGETIFNAIHPDDEVRGRQQLARAVAGGPGVYGPERFRFLHADGAWRHLEATGSNRLDDPDVDGVVFVLRDVSEQIAAQEELRRLALHDPLTGLANRTLVRERLDAALAGARRDGGPVALLVVDLDGFKGVNDRLGHDAGDALLVALAGRFTDAVREVDTVGRLGGDEFAVVLPGVEDPAGVARRLVALLRQPVPYGEESVTVGASVGLAVAGGDDEAVELFRRADRAMYRAKADGTGVAAG